jgi:putative ABC transport system permease protein
MSRTQRIGADAFQSLIANRPRALLMMLGLAVGVSVLSAVISVAEGTRARIQELVERHELDMIMIRAGGDAQVFAPQADRGLASLLDQDAQAIATEIANVALVSGVQNQRGINVVFEDRALTTRAFGVDPDWAEIRRWRLADGEFVSTDDVASMARVVLLGLDVARRLFPDGDAIGRVIRVNNDPYVVKGVFGEMGWDAAGIDFWDDRIVVPSSTSARRLFNRPYLEQIVVRVSNPGRIDETAEAIRSLLRVRHGIGPDQPDDFFVREPEHIEGTLMETPRILLALMAGVSLVALLAGGLVIMNLMLIAVTQRAQEIGLRRALGARASDITRQFLMESLLVSLAGGLAGVVLGLIVAVGLDVAGVTAARVSVWPFAGALLACATISVAFGIYPAQRAARIDPAATLRGRPA